MPDQHTTRRRFIAGAGAAGAGVALAGAPDRPSPAGAVAAARCACCTSPTRTSPRTSPAPSRSRAPPCASGSPIAPTSSSRAGTRSTTRCTRTGRPPRRSGPPTSASTRACGRPWRTSWATTTAGRARARRPIRAGRRWRWPSWASQRSYYSLTLRGWKLIVLDSIELTGGGAYVGRLGDEQTAWLAAELARTPDWMHVVLVTHIPIQTALPFTDSSLRAADGSFTVPPGWGVHSDLPELNELFIDHPNVRLALSGHNHVRDDITYNTVRFACGGSIAGNWWDEADPGYRDTPAGFAIVDLQRDGTADIHYWSYREVDEREVSADGPARGSRRVDATAARGRARVPEPAAVHALAVRRLVASDGRWTGTPKDCSTDLPDDRAREARRGAAGRAPRGRRPARGAAGGGAGAAAGAAPRRPAARARAQVHAGGAGGAGPASRSTTCRPAAARSGCRCRSRTRRCSATATSRR